MKKKQITREVLTVENLLGRLEGQVEVLVLMSRAATSISMEVNGHRRVDSLKNVQHRETRWLGKRCE